MSLRVGSPGDSLDPGNSLVGTLEERLRDRLGSEDFDAWFASTPCRYHPPGIFVFTAQSPFRTKWIETKYGGVLHGLVRDLCGQDAGIRFESAGKEEQGPAVNRSTGGVGARDPGVFSGSPPRGLSLDDFVVGPGSRVAYAAATAVVEHPGKTYSPLCIHGPSGVGKTLLLRGIALRLSETSNLSVCCDSSEVFTNRYIEAAGKRNLDSFHSRYRDCGVLILDDIHFLAGKKKTLGEFFFIFEHHLNQGNQVVLSTAIDPGELAGLPARLLARFRSGLITPVEVPNFETRAEVVSRMAERKGFRLPAVTAEYLAQHVTENFRELEGSLNCLINMSKLHRSPLTLEMAKAALDEFLDLGTPAHSGGVGARNIIDIILDHYGLEEKDLLSAKKVRTVVRARQVGMYLARLLTPLSLTQIGALFGGRDHTTVLYALRQIEGALDKDSGLRSDVEIVRSRLSVAHLH